MKRNRSAVFLLPGLCLASATLYYASAALAAEQSLSLGLSQQRQHFEFDAGDKRLDLQGYQLQYQLGLGDWRFSLAYDQAETEDSADQSAQYQLNFETWGYSLFAEYNWTNSWLALGYGASEDETAIRFSNPTTQRRYNRDVRYQNLILESGYLYFRPAGQWRASASLTHQWLKDTTQTQQLQASSGQQERITDVDERALLAALGINYSHYFKLSETLELSLAAGMSHQFSIDGQGQLQQFTRVRSASSRNQNSHSESLAAPE